MSKLFETSQDVKDLAFEKFSNCGLEQIGINLKVVSTPKAKAIIKVQKANPTTQFLTNKDVIMTVYEAAFDRLSNEHKHLLMEGSISNISYDGEKDKINVETDFAKEIFRMRRKYPNYVDVSEESYIVIEQLEDEERRRKEEEKLAKKEKRK